PSVPRISDLAHLRSSSVGKLELDLLGGRQMSEAQVLEMLLAEAVKDVFEEYVTEHGLADIAEIFARGVKVEVGDTLPSSHYADLLKRVPPAWEKAFEVNPAESAAVRASCVEFVLAGLYATDRISRSERHGRVEYEVSPAPPGHRGTAIVRGCLYRSYRSDRTYTHMGQNESMTRRITSTVM